MAADRGDMDTPKKIIKNLTDPHSIFEIRVDRRFDEIRRDDHLERFLDLEAAANKQIGDIASRVARYPAVLEGHIAYSDALELVRRYQDALDAIEPIAQRLREPGGRDAFIDADRYENWALERYSHALARLDFDERADAIHLESSQLPKDAGGNVSQRINYASSQFAKGNHGDALRSIADVNIDNTSDYGSILIHQIRICANAMGGFQRDYFDDLSYLIEKERKFGGVVLRAYLCLDQMDSAAQNLIRRLEHPDQRIGALMSLQNFADEREDLDKLWLRYKPNSATNLLDPGELLDLRFDMLRQRDDVLEAVDAVGRIEMVPLDSGRGT